MTAYKTVLAPNAPWPQRDVVLKGKKVRSKPSDTDAKFEAWLLTIKPIGVERIKQ